MLRWPTRLHTGASPVSEILRADRIIACAGDRRRRIHPLRLSQEPDFVDRDRGRVGFIGPSAQAIRAMDWDAAKRLMEGRRPVVPGHAARRRTGAARARREIGYPVLIRAGWRRRQGCAGRHPDDFAEALSGARRGPRRLRRRQGAGRKYVDKPRHIEVQVFGDNFGNAVHLFGARLLAQRRHQKVIEEAPALR